METKRPYHSPRRQEQARQTRAAVLGAARRLFGQQGYTATTLAAIAREANVSLPTVTTVFGTKAALLEALSNEVLGSDAATAPAMERPWWRAMLAEPDARNQIQVLVANGRRVHERGADVYAIVRGAATADPEFAAIMKRRHARLWTDMWSLAELLAERGSLAAGVTVKRATDLLWTFCGPEMYRLLVVECGWEPDEYELWVVSTLTHAIVVGC